MTGQDMTTKPDVAALVRELRDTLDQIGDALVDGAFDDLIATESRLAGLAGGFTRVIGDGPIPLMPPSELDAALAALRRCQRLGTSFTEVGTAFFGAGAPQAYTRSGRPPAARPPAPRATFDTRA